MLPLSKIRQPTGNYNKICVQKAITTNLLSTPTHLCIAQLKKTKHLSFKGGTTEISKKNKKIGKNKRNKYPTSN